MRMLVFIKAHSLRSLTCFMAGTSPAVQAVQNQSPSGGASSGTGSLR